MKCIVVAEYKDAPTEGMNVVSRTLIDDLRLKGVDVSVVSPSKVLLRLPALLFSRSRLIVFTHGPGPRTVLASLVLRVLSRLRIVWVATRPDLSGCLAWLRNTRTAHAVVCNSRRSDLTSVARDAEVVLQPIGIAPERLGGGDGPKLWPGLRRSGVPVAVHVGHLRASRGLERLATVKNLLGDRIEVVVQASPYFEPEPDVLRMLGAAGVHVSRGFVAEIAQVYRSADLYLFPAAPDHKGAIDLPLSVVEAMACRVPVIATRFGALPEILDHEEGVTLVGPDDFAQSVARWVELAPALRRRPDGLPDALNAHHLSEVVMRQADV